MKKKKLNHKKLRRILLAVFLFLLAASPVFLYIYQHEDDWVSADEALHIALHDAGTDDGRVYDVSTIYGTAENDLPVFEILFTDHTATYRYVVDAQTGRVLDSTKTLTEPGV